MPHIGRVLAVGALIALTAGVLVTQSTVGVAKSKELVAEVQNATGNRAGTVRFSRSDDGKVLIRARLRGLTPGFHGFHVHSVGVCDREATDPGGNPSPFFSAGGHYNPVATNTHGAHSGDMPPLLVTQDGTAVLRFKTDRFTLRELRDDDGSAVIVHAGPDNLAHIPATTSTGAERYHSHSENVFGADSASKATGDAGARFGCGIVRRG
jgi:Cu-Zn family superoxide dismutase